uniref:Uncharacterized protein n=1 Tax=Anguilla anguilla TaxID=7936 RepID=A0A0E9Q164_ANGAN
MGGTVVRKYFERNLTIDKSIWGPQHKLCSNQLPPQVKL